MSLHELRFRLDLILPKVRVFQIQGIHLLYRLPHYQPYLNHFTQPDSIVPDPSNSQAWDRYAYALNNPVRYKDPSGHNYCQFTSNTEDEDCQYIRENRKFNEFPSYARDNIVNGDWQVKKQYGAFEAMNLGVYNLSSISCHGYSTYLN